MVEALNINPLIPVVSPSALEGHLSTEAQHKHELELTPQEEMSGLASYVRTQYEIMRNHRNNSTSGWNHRLLAAMRAFNGQYSSEKLAQIRKYGGSEVYARVIAMKCRGASALLRDVYLAPDRAWGIEPPSDPDIPNLVVQAIKELVSIELQTVQQAGAPPPDAETIRDRVNQLMEGAREAERGQAAKRAKVAQGKIDEILEEGGFYSALAEFLVDLPLFPFGCIKGPVVRILPNVRWQNGVATPVQEPVMTWQRVSPFDIYFTPGASTIEDAAVIERTRFSRSDLNDLLDLPGYNHDNVMKVLDEYGRGGLSDDWDTTDSQRADYENRENPTTNQSGMINCLEYHGNVQGRDLLEYGFDPQKVPEPMRDYMVQAWLIGRYVIKVQLTPSPRKRHPYFISSFEKVPGTPVGNGLPDILFDIQEVANATFRSLVNNMSIASGPQVDVNTSRLAQHEDGNDLYPWKRWHTVSDPYGNNSQPAIQFFQPQSNAQELLTVYKELNNIADELSAIPKYLSGQGASGGAGRTAAGLAMLMGNASKILQTVAANIDRDIVRPLLGSLFDMILLTDETGILKGDESVRVMGVNVAVQKETERSRQLEFLTVTANPIDAEIMGTHGRAEVLRSVAGTIGLNGKNVIPSEDQLAQIAAQQKQRIEQQAAEAQGGQEKRTATNDVGPRVNIAGGAG